LREFIAMGLAAAVVVVEWLDCKKGGVVSADAEAVADVASSSLEGDGMATEVAMDEAVAVVARCTAMAAVARCTAMAVVARCTAATSATAGERRWTKAKRRGGRW